MANIFLALFLKNANVSKLRTDKNPTTYLYSKTTKPQNFLNETKNIKTIKVTKQAHAFKNYARTYNVEFLNSFIP